MLNEIRLYSFRQFDEKTVVFGAGNTSLRGANEGGKSTVIEGFLYVLGGAKACRNSDFVRWGAKPTRCKVEAFMTLQGTKIRAVRGKSGAEIYVPHDAVSPTVTGQNEVTAWLEAQLGASLDVISKMCFAGQKEIGGLLDEGNSKVVEFIEDMSGLDIVEFFINKIQATGKVGSTTALVERANADRAQLEAQSGISYEQAISDCEKAIGPLKDQKEFARSLAADEDYQLGLNRQALQIVMTYAANVATAKKHAERAINRCAETRGLLEAAENDLEAARAESAIEADLEAAQANQRAADDEAARIKAKKAFDAWPSPEAEWDEGVEALQAFITEHRTAERAAHDRVRKLESRRAEVLREKAVAESARVTSSACGLCGKDVSELPQVREKNASLDAQILACADEVASLVSKISAAQAESEEAHENAEAGDAILKAPWFELALTRPQWFEVDRQYVPFRAKWIGGDVSEALPDFKTRIAELKAERLARVNLDKERASAATAASSARVALDAAKQELAALQASEPTESEEALRARIATREQSVNEKRLTAFKLAEEYGSKKSLLQSLKQSQTTHADLVQRLTAALEKTEAELALYDFHNTLIEDLRKARPVVANQLWNMVLKSVSTYLTRMRGEPSIVERDGKTFIVNGRPYTSYSGSALDLLALGIRIALTKVFVPGAGMLVLDEPFAACDADRTMQCLSFAAAAGFEQTIIITHEGGTESVFDYIVEV